MFTNALKSRLLAKENCTPFKIRIVSKQVCSYGWGIRTCPLGRTLLLALARNMGFCRFATVSLLWQAKKKTRHKDGLFFWLGNRDSNPNRQSQSLQCYHYTIPQCCRATNIYYTHYFDFVNIKCLKNSAKCEIYFLQLIDRENYQISLDIHGAGVVKL